MGGVEVLVRLIRFLIVMERSWVEAKQKSNQAQISCEAAETVSSTANQPRQKGHERRRKERGEQGALRIAGYRESRFQKC